MGDSAKFDFAVSGILEEETGKMYVAYFAAVQGDAPIEQPADWEVMRGLSLASTGIPAASASVLTFLVSIVATEIRSPGERVVVFRNAMQEIGLIIQKPPSFVQKSNLPEVELLYGGRSTGVLFRDLIDVLLLTQRGPPQYSVGGDIVKALIVWVLQAGITVEYIEDPEFTRRPPQNAVPPCEWILDGRVDELSKRLADASGVNDPVIAAAGVVFGDAYTQWRTNKDKVIGELVKQPLKKIVPGMHVLSGTPQYEIYTYYLLYKKALDKGPQPDATGLHRVAAQLIDLTEAVTNPARSARRDGGYLRLWKAMSEGGNTAGIRTLGTALMQAIYEQRLRVSRADFDRALIDPSAAVWISDDLRMALVAPCGALPGCRGDIFALDRPYALDVPTKQVAIGSGGDVPPPTEPRSRDPAAPIPEWQLLYEKRIRPFAPEPLQPGIVVLGPAGVETWGALKSHMLTTPPKWVNYPAIAVSFFGEQFVRPGLETVIGVNDGKNHTIWAAEIFTRLFAVYRFLETLSVATFATDDIEKKTIVSLTKVFDIDSVQKKEIDALGSGGENTAVFVEPVLAENYYVRTFVAAVGEGKMFKNEAYQDVTTLVSRVFHIDGIEMGNSRAGTIWYVPGKMAAAIGLIRNKIVMGANEQGKPLDSYWKFEQRQKKKKTKDPLDGGKFVASSIVFPEDTPQSVGKRGAGGGGQGQRKR